MREPGAAFVAWQALDALEPQIVSQRNIYRVEATLPTDVISPPLQFLAKASIQCDQRDFDTSLCISLSACRGHMPASTVVYQRAARGWDRHRQGIESRSTVFVSRQILKIGHPASRNNHNIGMLSQHHGSVGIGAGPDIYTQTT